MDHNAEFHQGCINVPAPGVDDIYIVFAHGFCDADVRLANTTLRHIGARHLYPEPGALSANRGNGAYIEHSFYRLQMISASCGWLVPWGEEDDARHELKLGPNAREGRTGEYSNPATIQHFDALHGPEQAPCPDYNDGERR